MKRVAILSVLLMFLFGVSLQQVCAVSSTGKTTTKWGELKSKALEKSSKVGDPVLVMSEDDFAIAVRKYLSENQNSGANLAPINIGQYAFEIMRDFPGHPLRPCVEQTVPHINIHLYKNGKEVYNIHLGAYKDRNTGKFTLVFFGQNKKDNTNVCKQLSSQTFVNGFNAVKNFVEDGLRNMNANLGYVLPAVAITSAAYVIAITMYSVLVPLL